MATVMGGVGYGLYFTAKRYIIPLITPPTPPQLEQDKAAVDASFEKAFALLDQLSTDTTALKAAEESRTNRLDTALAEVEAVVQSLKDGEKKREDDARRNGAEIRGLRELIPQALDSQKEGTEERLRELGTELRSLKTLIGNRMGAAPSSAGVGHKSSPSSSIYGSSTSLPGVNGSATGSTALPSTSVPKENATDTNGMPDLQSVGSSTTAPAATNMPVPDRSQSATPSGSYASRFGSGRGGASIPAWQLAAGKKSQESLNGEKKDTSASGTVAEASAS
jgi:peroxin-14